MFEDAPHAYNMLIFVRSFAKKFLCYMAMELCKKINLRWVFLIFHFYLRRPHIIDDDNGDECSSSISEQVSTDLVVSLSSNPPNM